jgi:HNH endonuclease/AP2 domain
MDAKYSTVTQERLHKLYHYDAETGHLISKLFHHPVGQLKDGYKMVFLMADGKEKRFPAHRLIWMYVYGRWPLMIDHINGIKTDNRLCNLREVTAKQNAENKVIFKTKSGLPRSGYKGVHWCKQSNKWKASIGHLKKTIYLGMFDDPKEAFLAYQQAAKNLHTHNEQVK